MNLPNQKPSNNLVKERKEKRNTYAYLSGIAFQMISIIAVGTFIGVKLDEYFPNTHNLYTLFFSLGSVITSIIYVIRRIIANSKQD